MKVRTKGVIDAFFWSHLSATRMKLLLPLFSILSAASLFAQEPQSFERLKPGTAPKALSDKAKTSDWPHMLGPTFNAVSTETHLLHEFPADGLKKVWEVAKGDGYTSPSIVGDKCVIFHAIEGKETIECLHRETGKRFWSFEYPIVYQDRLGYANGPRTSPVISGDKVLTLGVTSQLHCLDLKSGKMLWKHDLETEYQVPQEFFGHGATPLIDGDRVFVNVGGKAEKIDGHESQQERMKKLASVGVCVAAYDLQTGKELWQVKDEWGSSYACPIMAELHGKRRLLVFAGGESNPVTGGLLCIDPKDGKVDDRFFWRADMYTSVNASTPVVIPGKNRVFVTTAYPKGKPIGGIMLEFDESLKAKEVWRSNKLACHWMTPIYRDGYLYAIDGETERLARLVCFNADTGEEVWHQDVTWQTQIQGQNYKVGIMRASLLDVDGATLCLGETGSLHWLDLSPKGCKELTRTQLWFAQHTWSLPVVSHGLLYVGQHDREQIDGTPQRFVCYDLRGE